MKALYKRLANYYDRIYHWKDYEKEADFVDHIMKKFSINGKNILDVACGTGTHAKLLKERGYSIEGLDINEEMLEVAKRKVKGAKFLKGDMKDFKLNKKFDAVLCLFSGIAYNRNKTELQKTIHNFYSHLKGHGVLILDTHFQKENLKDGHSGIDIFDAGRLKIARLSNSRVRNSELKINFVYLIKEKDKIDFDVDQHCLGVFASKEVQNVMKKVGFKTYIFSNFTKELYKKGSKETNLVFVGVKE